MIDKYPLAVDADWYGGIVARFGNAIPPADHLRIRRGLQQHVSDMYSALSDLDLLRHVDIRNIETRSATFIIIDAVDRAGTFDDESIALDFAIEHAQARLSESCEHCGRRGEIILKIGMEAFLLDPAAVLGDRFLCELCCVDFRKETDR